MSLKKSAIKHKYGDHERQRTTQYQSTIGTPSNDKTQPPLIFIHGGAWIDANNSDSDFDDFGLNQLWNITNVFSIDYRLTPEIKRPDHLNDIIAGIKSLPLQDSAKKVCLAGHSVGVTMLLELLDSEEFDLEVERVYLLDGIYEVNVFKEEYPKWAFFIGDAGYEDYSVNFEKLKGIEIHVIQSYKDELLSMRQTNWFIGKLQRFEIPYQLKVGNFGKHDEVYHNDQVAKYFNDTYN